MAEKRFVIADLVASYTIAEGMTATVDLSKAFPGFAEAAQNIRDAIVFALKTALRNATAGKMDEKNAEKMREAFESVKKRCTALESGKWASKREGTGGETRESVLARALSSVMSLDIGEAIAFIDAEVDRALEENGIDPDAATEDLTDEEKTKKRQISAAVRKDIATDPAIAIEMATIKVKDAMAKAKAAEAANAGKTSKFT